MRNFITPAERAALREARTPDARCALLLEWVLGELRYERDRSSPPVTMAAEWVPEELRYAKPGEEGDGGTAPKPGPAGHFQHVVKVRTNCDQDSLLYLSPPVPVEQADQLLPPAKRKRGRPRKTELGR